MPSFSFNLTKYTKIRIAMYPVYKLRHYVMELPPSVVQAEKCGFLNGSSHSSNNNVEALPGEEHPRWRIRQRKLVTLGALTLANCSNFWQRNLLYSLASAWPHECLEACEGALFVPLCLSCDSGDESCAACQHCRATHDADFYSLRDASCISDRQYGVLASVLFTIMFTASGVLAGSIADSLSQARWLHAFAILTWSLASFAKVITPAFNVLVATRFVLGIAQGFNAPCSYPVIVSLFSPGERATANGIYSVGTYLGSALSSLSLVAAMLVGWRMATTVAVVVGIFAAAMVYLVVERPRRDINCAEADGRANNVLSGASILQPRQRSSEMVRALHVPADRDVLLASAVSSRRDGSADVSLTGAWRRVSTNSRLILLYAATSLRMTTTVSLWTYLPTYYARAFPRNVVAFSAVYALGMLVCGSLSSAAGGAIADALVRHTTHSAARGYVPAAGTLLSVLPVAAALYAPTFAKSVGPLLASILLAECWLGPCMSLLANDVPNTAMGTHVALLLVSNQLIACVGPWALSSDDDGSPSTLRADILQIVALFSLASAAGFALLGKLHTSSAGTGDASVDDASANTLCFRPSRPVPSTSNGDPNAYFKRSFSSNFMSEDLPYTRQETHSLLATSSTGAP